MNTPGALILGASVVSTLAISCGTTSTAPIPTLTMPLAANATASATPSTSEDEVDTAQVQAACAAIQKKEHAALDALAAKGYEKDAIEAAKERIGNCMPLNKAAIVLSIDELKPAPLPEADPICDNVIMMPRSSLEGFGCFDIECPDCVRGTLSLRLVAPPFGSFRPPLTDVDCGTDPAVSCPLRDVLQDMYTELLKVIAP